MMSLWWVAAAFFVGSYAGALLVAVMSMARDETAIPRNSVGEHQLRNNAVTSRKIRPRTIHLSDIATSTRRLLVKGHDILGMGPE